MLVLFCCHERRAQESANGLCFVLFVCIAPPQVLELLVRFCVFLSCPMIYNDGCWYVEGSCYVKIPSTSVPFNVYRYRGLLLKLQFINRTHYSVALPLDPKIYENPMFACI